MSRPLFARQGGGRSLPYRRNITSLIDVVFLLTVFFMLSTEYGQVASVPILAGKDELPKAAPAATADAEAGLSSPAVTAVLLGRNMANVNGMVVPLDQSGYTLKTFLAHRRAADGASSVHILCRKEATLQELTDMIGVVRSVGVERLRIGYVR
jgi:biopolymer transport protein ExbD